MSENQKSEMTELEQCVSFVNEMRLLHDKEAPTILLNKEFIIEREVFHPNVFLNISAFINREFLKLAEEEIEKRSANESFDFLEVGCGAGYTSIFVALSSEKCRVWATDINAAAVSNTKKNAKYHGVEHRVTPVVADLFNSNEINGRKFDMIFWNCPWSGQHTDQDAEIDPLLNSIIDPGHRGLRGFFSDASRFIKATGRLIVTYSYTFGSEELFKKIANENGWGLKTCTSKDVTFELNGITQDIHVFIVELVHKQT
ncbi:putative protein methyltransferase MJ0928 [Exaiptasia diaphana]|nr:putative protein methyltransferase MJ0928 [Exaiptasia diaphana]